ncbi:MAG: hypothetical protein QNJ11_09335 [Woeseiaceae bacterium]|nr:hypothetical protein [Woeseiaceae bacterium]
MKYILFVLIVSDSDITMGSSEFLTQAACESAASDVREAFDPPRKPVMLEGQVLEFPDRYEIRTVCVKNH